MEDLRELPLYHEGHAAFYRGVAQQDLASLFDVFHGDAYEALKLGWREAQDEATSP